MFKEELTEELLQLSDISIQLKTLNSRFDNLASKNDKVKSDLLITKNSIILLNQWMIQLEWNAANNAQYHRREFLEVNPVRRDL